MGQSRQIPCNTPNASSTAILLVLPVVSGGACAIFQGQALSVVPLVFSVAQELTATLRVTDNPALTAACLAGVMTLEDTLALVGPGFVALQPADGSDGGRRMLIFGDD